LKSRFLLIFLALVVILLTKAAFGAWQKNSLAYQKYRESKAQLLELEATRDGLEAEIARLNTDRGLEEELRKKFQVVKSGEQALVIVDTGGAPTDEAPAEKSLWGKFIGFFGF